MAKQYLHSLTLKWASEKEKERSSELDEILLEGLQPHPKLRELSIEEYPGMMFPSWMMTMVISLPNIVSITLESCDRCKHLPQSLDQLPFLKSLTLRCLDRVEHINDEDDDNSNNHRVERKSSTASVFFPSLEELVIKRLYRLKGWWRAAGTSMIEEEEEEEEREESSQRPSFPRLTRLEIQDCKQLTWMPIHPSHLEELEVSRVPEKLVRELLLGSSSSIPSSSPLSKLKSLCITFMDDLEPLLPEEVLWKLSSLDKLLIFDIPKLVSLPVGLQQVTTLQHLHIEDCAGLMALPDWISNLTSLQSLHIRWCPLLSERCKKETGEDWSNISHIPNIAIDLKTIQGMNPLFF